MVTRAMVREWCRNAHACCFLPDGPLYDSKNHWHREVKKRVNLCAAMDEWSCVRRRENLFRSGARNWFHAPKRGNLAVHNWKWEMTWSQTKQGRIAAHMGWPLHWVQDKWVRGSAASEWQSAISLQCLTIKWRIPAGHPLHNWGIGTGPPQTEDKESMWPRRTFCRTSEVWRTGYTHMAVENLQQYHRTPPLLQCTKEVTRSLCTRTTAGVSLLHLF